MSEATLDKKSAGPSLAGRYLTFTLEPECYGIDVLKVREIIRLTTITPVPQMPPHMRGVINLRGKIIPVTDLRLRFGLDAVNTSKRACIIVVQVNLPDDRTTQVGLLVDGVEEVLNIPEADIEGAPDFGAEISTEYILGMAKTQASVKTLLDIDRIMGGNTPRNPPKI
jgi:purine-binding chemotaxis protein CheW